MEPVWAVMCGEYSDKYLAAVFTDHDRADAYARAHDGYFGRAPVSRERLRR